jgi:ubiquinone biosynthesis protein
LPEDVRILMAEFFCCMATRRGRRCAEIILESAAYIRPNAPLEEFISAVDGLVQKQSHDSIFSMSLFGNEIFALQQSFGLYAKSAFAFPLMSLVVLEGTLQQLNRDVDFRQLGTLSNPMQVMLAM